MSLSDLAAIGSFLSGIAVVFSFIFLALQVRQANRNQRSIIQQARTGRNVDILLRMSDPVMGETLAQAERDAASFSPARIWSFYGFGAAVFWSYEDSYMQLEAGTLPPGTWESDLATLKRILAFPIWRVIWRLVRDGMSGGYRDYVDTLMRDTTADPLARFTDPFAAFLAEELRTEGGQ